MSGKGLLRKLLLVSGFIFAGIPAASVGNDLPPPGYEWFACRTLGCFLLEPSGWNYKEIKSQKGLLHYRLTRKREQLMIPSRLDMRVLPSAEPRTGISLSQHMDFFVSDLKRKAKILDMWNQVSGDLKSVSAISLHTKRLSKPVKQFSLLVANAKTGTLYTFTFVSTPQLWEQDWPVMQEVLSQLRLDEEI